MLGSRKFLIVLFSCFVIGSIFVVGLSAEDLVREDPLMTSGEQVVLRSAVDPEYVLRSSGVLGFGAWLTDNSYTSSSNPYTLSDTCYIYADGGFQFTAQSCFASNSGNVVFLTGSNEYQVIPSLGRSFGFDSSDIYDFLVSDVGLSEADFVYSDAPTSIFAFALACLTSILGVGSQLVSFVIARPIVLIPIVAMVFVLGFGVIRRLVKGV